MSLQTFTAYFIFLIIQCFTFSTTTFAGTGTGLETVPFVDVSRYTGRWYQISRNPLPFEGDCACSQQTLETNADGTLSVYNSCNDKTPSGPLREIRGFATNDDPTSNSKFTVDFSLPRKGQYWIIGLDADYRYAVVSDPSLRSLFILSKTPELSAELYQSAIEKAALQVDTGKLISTLQQGCNYP